MNRPVDVRSVLRIFVVSDMHAFSAGMSRKKEPPSYIHTSGATIAGTENPLRALENLVTSERIEADVLLCCGDLGDKADPAGITYAWAELNKLKATLKAPMLLTTVGNHDLDSRYHKNSYDPKEHLQSLDPRFPVTDELHSDRFWARHFTSFADSEVRFVLLNSCSFHGAQNEHEKGRVADQTIIELQKKLREEGDRTLNILVCHHHPQKHSEYELRDYDDMVNGQRLLDLLGSDVFGPWIVFHGHKHCPKLSYAAGGVNSSIIFSAGSIGACLYPVLGANVRNQCYLIELPLCKFPQLGLVGSFTAWDWIPGSGCMPASPRSGLPFKGGFGNRIPTALLSKEIATLFQEPKRIAWAAVVEKWPTLEYLIPSDIIALANRLKRVHGLSVAVSDHGQISELERIP